MSYTTAQVADFCGVSDVKTMMNWELKLRPRNKKRGGGQKLLWSPEACDEAIIVARQCGYKTKKPPHKLEKQNENPVP